MSVFQFHKGTIIMLIPQSSAGRSYTGVLTTKKGNVTYYYPSDYIKVSGYAGNSK